MSSVSPITHDETFPQDAVTAQDRVDSSKLQTQVSNIKNLLNEIVSVLDSFLRDDDTLADQHVRLRMLHPELVAAMAASSEWQPKASVRLASTADLTLTGSATVDGVAVADGDRVLVKDQADATENGNYEADTGGAWTRSTDMDAGTEVPYAMVSVLEGDTNVGGTWLALVSAVTLGTTDIPFAQVFAPNQVLAGSGLTKTGVTFSVNVDGSTIEINAGSLRVKDGGLPAAKLATDSVTTVKIVDGNVTNPKLAPMAGGTIKANVTGAPDAPQDASPEDVAALLPVVVGDTGSGGVKGLVPAPAPGDAAAGKFLDAAGGYSVPSGSGGVNIQAFKDPCRAATTGNITLSGVQTVDGIACIAGDRVLVLFQTATAENGIYVVAAGAWGRATDADIAAEVVPGILVHVNEGTALAGTLWRLTGSGSITIGVTPVVFKEVGGWCGIELYRRVHAGPISPLHVTTYQLLGTFSDNGGTIPARTLDLGTVGEDRGAPYLTQSAGAITIGTAGAGRYRLSGRVIMRHGDLTRVDNMVLTVAVNGVEVTKLRTSSDMDHYDATSIGSVIFEPDGFLTLAVADVLTVRWHASTNSDTIQLGNSRLILERVSP
jgi:hypothetical protein